jgi:hypothetical protein
MGSTYGTFHYAGVTGNMAFISSEIHTLGLCVTAELVRNWPQDKRNRKRRDKVNGLAKKRRHELHYFWQNLFKGSARWEAEVRSVCLLNDVTTITYSEVTLHAVSRLPKYCANQNDGSDSKVCALFGFYAT